MADILIRGMDKPHNCFQCDLSYLIGERLFCRVTKDEVLRSKIAPDCPIIELPEHGDLISLEDAKTVITRFLGYIDDDLVFRMKFMLGKDCPVIVQSNKEETE